VLDVWSLRIVGWAMATHLRTELILEALTMAVTQRRPTNVIHHSDHGCQYTARRRFAIPAAARLDIFEGCYNPHRRHSALDYRSLANYERSQPTLQ